jgi:hypothetical protein
LGNVLECSQLSGEQLSATDDPAHIIRAELLRELLLKCSNKFSDPRGLRLRRARITGTLDLIHVRASIGMGLLGCSFDHSVLLNNAHLSWLALTGSRVPTLAGDGLEIGNDLFLDKGFHATGHGEDGAVRLRGAHVTGQLVMSGAELTNEAGPALAGDGLEVDGGLFLRSLRARGYGRRGVVRLWGAHVRGQLVPVTSPCVPHKPMTLRAHAH